MTLEISQQILEKSSNIKFRENTSSESRVVPRGQMGGRTDMTKILSAFRNFANAPKNSTENNVIEDIELFLYISNNHNLVPSIQSCIYKELPIGF
jgi:hypothetical protein